ncbi:MAG: hypothetical protein ACK5NG_11660, partial [Chthoniobacterales bacterium]
MKTQSLNKNKASALVIVLAFVVLVSIVMLSYLADTQLWLRKSTSSSTIVQTDLLANTAVAAVIGDIRQEMLAGSDGSSLPAAGKVMSVSQPQAMTPERILANSISETDTNFFNLIKQSIREKEFYPGTNNPPTFTAKGSAAGASGRKRASAVNSADADLNGRSISPTRWNKPLLLKGSGFTSNAQLPDWILISREGPLTDGSATGSYTNNTPSNNEYVIGRFAYNIYDLGGLIDINVVGYPSVAAGDARKKGSPVWADLEAIPGISDPDELIDWRNKSSKSDYFNMVQGRLLSGTNSAPQPWGESGGFRKPYSTGTDSDNRFFTRQDLLKYAQTYGTNAISTNALPYLTTFSADLDQPSFAPNPTRSKILRNSSGGGNDLHSKD